MADKDLPLSKISKWTESVLQQWEGYFLTDLKMLPNNAVRVFVDADQGASIDDLARINRSLRKEIEASTLFPEGNFSLEVSSPGLDEPLRQLRQYKKNTGREVEVLLKNGQKKKGLLKEVQNDFIVLEYKLKNKKGKKAKTETPVKEPERFSFDEIKNTKVCVGF